ncbi:hypothetical protein GE061_009831 [Apolygus lucorum]|uniref:Odorant receptor n=1 Tax=Apolygus lucorum TaxID=248454 RepID=A0A6A4KGX8_APOLU|nr:hypothetical protein GE061_009831 [Apolygus lucorum]
MTYAVASAVGFVLAAFSEKDRDQVLENIHFVPLIFNMASQAASYHYTQKEYLQLFRAVDSGFFNYDGDLDIATELEITEVKSVAKNRKKKFGHFYSMLMLVAGLGQILKKPLLYVLRGGGTKPVDGENNLVWEAPYGMYVPYADHWISYLTGMFLGYSACTFVSITAVGSVLSYQYMSEELLAEFKVVEITFSKCLRRAQTMYENRKNVLKANGKTSQITMKDCIIHCMNLSVKHHQHTLRMMNVFKDLMFFPLFMVIFDGALVLCISAYLTISDDVSLNLRITMPSVITAEATLAFIFCYYGEKLTEATEDVGDSIYNSDGWVQHSDIIRPYALIVKSFCNIPNELSAAGFSSVNHNTFGNLLSTAYSYIGYLMST